MNDNIIIRYHIRLLRQFLAISVFFFVNDILSAQGADNEYNDLSKDSSKSQQLVLRFLENITNPTRDIPNDYTPYKYYRVKEDTTRRIIASIEYSQCRGSCEDLYAYCDELDVPVLFPDAFGNYINYFGFYGSDPRQRYYVYPPTGTPNGSVAILVHGGAWFSGPNPDEVLGFPFQFAPQGSNQSLVKDLLSAGYTVVSILYRTAKLGATDTEVASNFSAGKSAMDRMLDDIEDAIEHFKNRMDECYELTFSKFHVIGESSGGHASLMYAYTRANPSYVKSVTAMYAPVNIEQFFDWISNPQSVNMYSCSTTYVANTFTTLFPFSPVWNSICSFFQFNAVGKHNPFYWIFNTNNTEAYFNYFDTDCIATSPNLKVFDGYNLIRSLLGDDDPDASALVSISPVYQSNVGIIPTFAMYGYNDFVVIYDQSAQDFETNLNVNGGVVLQNNICQSSPMPALGPSEKHLIRKYEALTHGFLAVSLQSGVVSNMFTRVRSDILHWLDTH